MAEEPVKRPDAEGVLVTPRLLDHVFTRLRRLDESVSTPQGRTPPDRNGSRVPIIRPWKITGTEAKVGKRYPYLATAMVPIDGGTHYAEMRPQLTTKALWNDIEEINEGDALPVGLVVWAIEVYVVRDGKVLAEHRIIGVGSSLPKGQYQYQVYQMVSQNTSGWDFVRAHPVL